MRSIGLVPVLRASSTKEAITIAKTVYAAGVAVIEVTMTVPDALSVIRTLVQDLPDFVVGAGTVLDPETARICILEGAQFIVSPATNLRTIELCQRYTVPMISGALTPTEVLTAWQAGADVIKVFPVSAMGGASYLRSLKDPLPQIELLPTGGVSVANAKDFLMAGALALGVGRDLIGAKEGGTGELSNTTVSALAYLKVIADFRRA